MGENAEGSVRQVEPKFTEDAPVLMTGDKETVVEDTDGKGRDKKKEKKKRKQKKETRENDSQ